MGHWRWRFWEIICFPPNTPTFQLSKSRSCSFFPLGLVNHSCCYLGRDLTAYIRNGCEVAQMCLLREPFSWWWQKSGKVPDTNLSGFFFLFFFQNKTKQKMGKRGTYTHQPHIYKTAPFYFFSFQVETLRSSEKTGSLNIALPRVSSINQSLSFGLKIFSLSPSSSICCILYRNSRPCLICLFLTLTT